MSGSADRHYVAVDGGAGAPLLGELRHVSPRLIEVASPRHADLLVAVEPISRALAPFVAETYRALPRPRAALTIGVSQSDLAEILPGIHRIDAGVASAEAVARAALTIPPGSFDEEVRAPEIEPLTEPLPSKHDRDMATELVVLTLGPIQPFTAGPLRLVLACDGEQVISARIEAGYAARDIAGAMRRAAWADAARLAEDLDPLAPVAGRLAFVTAMEQLQHHQPAPAVAAMRDAALAVERVQNHIWWLERFAAVLGHDALADQAGGVGSALRASGAALCERSAVDWIAPGAGGVAIHPAGVAAMRHRVRDIEALRSRLARDAFFASRTQGIGVIDGERLRAADITGPVLRASTDMDGDSRCRLLVRLDTALADLRQITEHDAQREDVPMTSENWTVPAGEATATVEGPRGNISVRIRSTGAGSPAAVEWRRPSAALLGIIPELLADQTLADAELILASLDLATAEADG